MATSSTQKPSLPSSSSSASLESDWSSSLSGIPGTDKDDSELCALENILKSIPTPSNGSSPTPSMELELKAGEEEPLPLDELSSAESDNEETEEGSLADLRPPSDDEVEEEEEEEDEENGHNKDTEQGEEKKDSTTKTKKRKRKGGKKTESEKKNKRSRSAHERKNIRSILKGDQLDKETLNAQQEEMERIRRIQELKKNALSLEAQMAHMYKTPPASAEAAEAEQARPKDSFLKSLLESAEDEASAVTSKQGEDIILLDSGDESKAHRSKEKSRDVIAISSDEEDVMMCSDQDDGMEPEDDPNNSGSHVNDAMNQPDAHGRVLVNVGHPPDEPDIFLLHQLAGAVKPHQIGGIRFLYDNLVESLERYKTSNGFGCILAHSMGLGKTLQVISFIDIFLRYSDARTVLCIVPINTLQNWVSEFNKWIPKEEDLSKEDRDDVEHREFSVFIVNDNHKTTFARAAVIEEWYTKGGVLLMGYEMYRLLSSRRGHIAKPKRSKKGETVVIDVEEEDKNKGLLIDIHQGLIRPGPDLVICDEGHRIKNAHASTSQALKSIRTRRRVVLTGYPLQNNLLEYWCMVDFVRPNFLGNKTEFSNMFERPIMNGQCADSTPQDVRLMRFRAHVLHSLLEGFVQRRGHAVLRAALPPKEEYVLFVRLSPIQKRLYSQFMSQSQSLLMSLANNNPLKAFAVCCKIWNHPDTLYNTMKSQRVVDDNDLDLFGDAESNNKKKGKVSKDTGRSPIRNGSSANLDDSMNLMIDKKEPQTITYDWAEPLLADYEQGILENSGKMTIMFQIIKQSMALGDKCLIFSQSLLTLNLIEEFLGKHTVPLPGSTEKWAKNKNYFRLDGSTAGTDREKLINQFNVPFQNKFHLFLLSTRAGCLGINLIGANRVIIFDASWNPCHDCQAVCRVYRYGQTKCCFVYRLVSNNTMERKIYERQINKQGMSDRVVDEMNIQNNFTRRQVESLLTYEDKEEPPLNTDGCEYRYPDKVIISCLRDLSYWITKEPFTHESLLIDRKDQKLTKMEKRLAKQSYEEEKKLKVSYSRPSYAAYYPKNAANLPAHIPSSQFAGLGNSMFTWMQQRQNNQAFQPDPSSKDNYRYAQLPNPNRPVASVRPIMSTPLPMQLKSQGEGGERNLPMQNFQRPGVFMQQVQTTTDISIPGTVSTSESGARTKIPAGETVLVIKTPKGVYIRTSEGKIFAVRSAGSKYDGIQVSTPDAPHAPSTQSTTTSSTTSVSYGGSSSPFSGMYASSPWMNNQGFGGSMYSMSQGMGGMYSSGMTNKSNQPQGQTDKSLSTRSSEQGIGSPNLTSLDSQSSMSSAGHPDNHDADSKDSNNKDDCDSPEVKIINEKPSIRRMSSMPSMSPNMGMNYPGYMPYSPQGFNMPPYHMGMMPQMKSYRKDDSNLEMGEKTSALSQESGKDTYASSSQGLMSGGKAFIPTNSGTASFNFSQHLPASTTSKNFSEKFPMAKQGLESLLSLSSKEETSSLDKNPVSTASVRNSEPPQQREPPDSIPDHSSSEPDMNRKGTLASPLSADKMDFLDKPTQKLSDEKEPFFSYPSSQVDNGQFGGQPADHSRKNTQHISSHGNFPFWESAPFPPQMMPHSRSVPSFTSNMGLYNFPYGPPSQMHMYKPSAPLSSPGLRGFHPFPHANSLDKSELPNLSTADVSQTVSNIPSSSQSST